MTSAQLLARCRTLLDESSAGFFTDAEIYSALTDGQKEVANVLVTENKQRLPETLRPLVTTASTSGASITLPATFWIDLTLKFGSTSGNKQTAYREEVKSLPDREDNSYLNNEFYYYIDDSTLYFGKAGTQYYTFTYLVKPTTIDGSTEPILEASSHNAIVFWATAQMLFKDQRPQEAQTLMKSYKDELQTLV